MGPCRVLLLLALLAAASARQLQQAYDCAAAEAKCKENSCKGKIEFQCDAATSTASCKCESAGLAGCFPGAATVATADGGVMPLSSLALGDRVLAVAADGSLQYTPVVMFSSRRPTEQTTFLRIHTNRGLNVTVTPGHYMFAWKGGEAAAAKAALQAPTSWPHVLPTQLEVGDWLPVAAQGSSSGAGQQPVLAQVTVVERLVDVGVFMPHTFTGAIVVDGVVASELTSFVPQVLAGPAVHRSLAAVLRAAYAVLPASVVEAAVRGMSALAHGGVGDAAIAAGALFTPVTAAA